MRHAIVAGASGLTGGHLVEKLAALPYRPRVICPTRRPLEGLPPQVDAPIVDLADVSALAAIIPPLSWVFCCLGTTMARAGSREAFRRVDLELPLALGRAAKQAGAQGFSLVSSVGANTESMFFYSRVKGEAERELEALALPSLHIFRPGLLTGRRAETRPGERLAQIMGYAIAPFLIGPLQDYNPIRAERVARAMVIAAERSIPGVDIFHNRQIRRLTRRGARLT